jgi:GNAT superfamily N-acetyltransferase
MNVIGIHFRQYIAPGDWQLPVDLTIRPAEIKDEAIIINVNEEIFESDDEVTEYIEKGQILLFEKGSDLVGFGIFARVIEDRAEFDIGMLVTKEYRRQGYGRRIIRYMADYCQQKGWRPICGCAIENVASRRTLEKAGFIAGYRLLEFAF